ncbi:hypothetical protein EST38_g13817 [Candolleomyces aberdarensis]|uniref:Uncharacterized protein n=1 Tax=Candolleomyces aberdarensis TaxID=2316362 RepID=A0A4V1Q1L8_9AGAR|nr:hypothetical protein EST38_g13817 [Candolleomyces aberdarensis]
MKFISAVTVATTVALLQTAGLVSALDMRFWSSKNCSGGFLQCGNLPAGVCCSLSTNPAGSLRVSDVSNVADFSAWGTRNCQAPLAARSSLAACIPGNFAFFSGNWRSRSRIGGAVEQSSTEDCVESDSFGFVDETGKEHIAKITEANKKAIYGALEMGDVAALETEAGAAA